jgi:hypothetical protein
MKKGGCKFICPYLECSFNETKTKGKQRVTIAAANGQLFNAYWSSLG